MTTADLIVIVTLSIVILGAIFLIFVKKGNKNYGKEGGKVGGSPIPKPEKEKEENQIQG